MKTIFMNTENSMTNESKKFIDQCTDKLNLKNPNNKNTGWLIQVFTTRGKTSNQNTITINLKYLLQLGMLNLICLMFLIQFLTFRITLNLSSKNVKL